MARAEYPTAYWYATPRNLTFSRQGTADRAIIRNATESSTQRDKPEWAARKSGFSRHLGEDMLEKLKNLDGVLSKAPEDRRRETREDLVGGRAEINGEIHPLRNWSAHGFCIGPTILAATPGDRLDITFHIPLSGRTLTFTCRSGVMRCDAKRREIGGVFFNVPDEIQQVIDEHFQIESPKRSRKDFFQNLKASLRR